MILYTILLFVYVVNARETHANAGTATDSYKDQYCTDPRTMRKHAAYSEWADAYSCTRHRCQPGGRNLAIYTVGCKRVEAPESAIECEEVVEDTNMQFPYCCTRLRCLVVVRGEVWTRVLGQPWETLPAAPWSHMYKMKKPPPVDGSFLPKTADGPIYELSSDTENGNRDKMLRSGKKMTTVGPDCNHAEPRSGPTPDIVIALSTDGKELGHKKDGSRYNIKRLRKTTQSTPHHEDIVDRNELDNMDIEEPIGPTEKPPDMASEERFYAKSYGVTKKPYKSQQSWTDIPQNQWNEAVMDIERKDTNSHQPDLLTQMTQQDLDKKDDKPNNLQALVDAIGTRMRDIENVVQKMSEKVHQKPGEPDLGSIEKRTYSDNEVAQNHYIPDVKEHGAEKKSNIDDQYKRFAVRNHGSQYLNNVADGTTDQPSEDNGYFSDASNTLDRRSNRVNPPKEPQAQIYMAPVDTRRKAQHASTISASEEVERKRKKRTHKKKKTKGHSHKKRRTKATKEEKRKRDKISSVELEKNIGSLEDTSALGS